MSNRPKRRKHKDNPYILNYIEEKNIYIIEFKDADGIIQEVEVNEKIYKVFDGFELEDLSELNKYDNHIEHSELYDNTLEKRIMDKPMNLDDEIIRKTTFENLRKAINKLPEIQKRRIKKYYFDEKTQQKIADEENVNIRAVQYSLNLALKKLKEILK